MCEVIDELIGSRQIQDRIKELAQEINRDYKGRELHMICLLKGSVFFCCELAKHLLMPVTIDFMTVSSYGSGTESSGDLLVRCDLAETIEDRHCLIVEDIIDSGNTLRRVCQMLERREPASLRLCTLLDKPSQRVCSVEVDYTGFVIPDEFVVGYGLDYDQKYRNLPYIGIIKFAEEGESDE